MSSAPQLSEPRVLASTKQAVLRDDAEQSYAVTDTQFATREWLAGQTISDDIRDILSPFNRVKVGSGYPDIVAVTPLDEEFIVADEQPAEPPLVAIEAKGYDDRGSINVERGIVQAHDRLTEANVTYVVAPTAAIGQSAQTLARQLNIGILGVSDAETMNVIERPRFVGNQGTNEARAIRFQASAQGVADQSFSLNHPKNYLGYPLALYHPEETASVLSEYVVSDIKGARTGASFLGMIETSPRGEQLTPLGKEVVRFAHDRYGSVEAALQEFEGWKRSRKRFYDLAPEWGLITRRVLWEYPATKLIVEELQTLHQRGNTDPSLVEFVTHLNQQSPSFTVELFIKGDELVRRRVLTNDGELRTMVLADGKVYHSPTVFQLKAMLYHAGILTERGREPNRLDPESDIWKLEQHV